MRPFTNIIYGMVWVFVLYKYVHIKPEPSCAKVIANLIPGMTLGSASALRRTFVCKNEMNEQELEYYYQVASSVLNKEPDQFFEALREYNVERKELEKFLLAKPIYTLNDIDKKLAPEIENRIGEIKSRIRAIKESRDTPLKPVALKILENELADLYHQKLSE